MRLGAQRIVRKGNPAGGAVALTVRSRLGTGVLVLQRTSRSRSNSSRCSSICMGEPSTMHCLLSKAAARSRPTFAAHQLEAQPMPLDPAADLESLCGSRQSLAMSTCWKRSRKCSGRTALQSPTLRQLAKCNGRRWPRCLRCPLQKTPAWPDRRRCLEAGAASRLSRSAVLRSAARGRRRRRPPPAYRSSPSEPVDQLRRQTPANKAVAIECHRQRSRSWSAGGGHWPPVSTAEAARAARRREMHLLIPSVQHRLALACGSSLHRRTPLSSTHLPAGGAIDSISGGV